MWAIVPFSNPLNLYLTKHKYANAEAQDLRLAFEEVTGKDLNWFWNQWYYSSGHPKLEIHYDYNATSKTAMVYMKQTQGTRVFTLPFFIDVYQGGTRKRYSVWMKQRSDTFAFPANAKPGLVNVDADKILLCEKKDDKTLDEFIFQYENAGSYVDRREAVVFALNRQTDPKALEFLKKTLNDKSWRIRDFELEQLNVDNDTVKAALEVTIAGIAKTDPNKMVKAMAIETLGKYNNPGYKDLFLHEVRDSSYTVAGRALKALGKLDAAAATEQARMLSGQPAKGELKYAIIGFSDETKFDSLSSVMKNLPFGNEQFSMVESFAIFLGDKKHKSG